MRIVDTGDVQIYLQEWTNLKQEVLWWGAHAPGHEPDVRTAKAMQKQISVS